MSLEKKGVFENILKRLFLFTARPSSVQRDILVGSHFSKNKFHSLSNILTMPISKTDVEWYFDKEDLNLLLEKEAKEFFKKAFLKEYQKRNDALYKEWIKVCACVHKIFSKKINLKNKNIEKIKAFLDYPTQNETYFYFTLSVWAFEQKVVPIYEKILRNFFGQEFEKKWEIITSQTKLNNEQKLRIKLLDLKKKYKQSLPKTKLKEVQKKYRYLGVYSPEDYGLYQEDIIKIYNEIGTSDREILKKNKKNKKLYQNLLKTINDKKIREILEQINFNVYFRAIRSEKISYGLSLTTPFYDHLMKKLNFNRKEVGNLTKEEILNFLERKAIPPKRKTHPGMLYHKGTGRELSGDEKKLFNNYFRKKISIDTFSGNIANKGRVEGIVKVITSISQLSKVEEGDILISQFTRPEYMHAIKKSSAIVTNDGGITCHAAIVSRELNKPCIIGTKIATKVLKDGDLVEVNAYQGIVKILKKVKK